MKKHKIKITYSRYEHQYQIELFERVQLPFFNLKWWSSKIIQRGSIRNITYYQLAWMKEFSVSEDNVEDLTA